MTYEGDPLPLDRDLVGDNKVTGPVKQVMIEQELMRRVVVQVLRNQRLLLSSVATIREAATARDEALEITRDILDELED